jgi:uncharacterized protein YprB with RNaseH-like and TPR domain
MSTLRDKLRRVHAERAVERPTDDVGWKSLEQLDRAAVVPTGLPLSSHSESSAFVARAESSTALPTPAVDPERKAELGRKLQQAQRLKTASERSGPRNRSSAGDERWPDVTPAPPFDTPAKQALPPLSASSGSRDNSSPVQKRPVAVRPGFPTQAHLPGRVAQTSGGDCFVVVHRSALSSHHGDRPLLHGLSVLHHHAQQLDADGVRQGEFDVHNAVFLDLETTGLSAANGDMAFVVGMARVVGDQFIVQQVIAHHRREERAALLATHEVLSRASSLVTFNGASFDLKFLRERFIAERLSLDCLQLPHVDVLKAARRVFGKTRGSLRLPNVESICLGYRRHGDIPGSEAPGRFARTAETGDPTPILPIIEHNRLDLVSLLPILGVLAGHVETPVAAAQRETARSAPTPAKQRVIQRPEPRHEPPPMLAPSPSREGSAELRTERQAEPRIAPASTGRVPGLSAAARAVMGAAGTIVRTRPDPGVVSSAAPRELREKARAHARANEFGSALICWQQLAERAPLDSEPHVEMSRLFEQAVGDLKAALVHAVRAAELAPHSAPLQRRLSALRQRLGRG